MLFSSLRQHHPDEIAVAYSLELVEGWQDLEKDFPEFSISIFSRH